MDPNHFMRFTPLQPPKQIPLMRHRLILISILALQFDSATAGPATWNCDKIGNDGKWDCSLPSTGAKTPSSEKSAYAVEKSTNETLETPESSLPTKRKRSFKPVMPAVVDPRLNEAPVSRPITQTCNNNAKNPAQACKGAIRPDLKTSQNDAKEDSFELLKPAYNRAQERIFSQLQTRLKVDPWGACRGSWRGENPYSAVVTNRALREIAPMEVESDYSEIFDKVVTSFSGNVAIERADQNVFADKVNYNSRSETLDAQGNVYYREDEISMFSDSVLLNLNTDQARLRDTLFISPRAGVRGTAKVVYQENKDFSHYKEATYTSCPPGNQDWVIHADRLKMNKATGLAAAKHAWLEFKGVPLLYTPYISFPLDSRRMTGFLTPRPSLSGVNGVDISLPFYWNIAPNYDVTFRPRYLAKRGIMLGADLRYMNQMTFNELNFDVLPYDDKRLNQTRYQASFKNRSLLTPHLNTNIDLNYVSDKKYISELGNALSFTDIRHVRSVADLNYQREGVSFLTRLENYQTIDQSIPANQKPYRKLPQVMLNLNHSFEKMPLTVGMDNDFVIFQHNTNVDGLRLSVKPMVSAPIKSESGFITPKASFLHSDYILNNQLADKQSDISRNLPIFSLDTGLFAEADFKLGGTSLTHTLEPRLFYLYIPKSDQNDLPIFDTAFNDPNFDSLFRENRFSNVDRVQNANQLTVALSSRLLDGKTGRERLKASIGDIIYFQDRQAQSVLSTTRPSTDPYDAITLEETNRFSNIITELSGQLTDDLSFSSGFQWDPYTSTSPRKQIDLHYRNKWGHILNVGYHHRKNLSLSQFTNDDIVRQGDISFRLPLLDNWHAVGRWQYSFLYNRTAESFLGLEKENCCWRFRIIGRHYINGLTLTNAGVSLANPADSATGDSQTTVMLQIELKNLSSFGNDVDAFLKQSIFGYSDL